MIGKQQPSVHLIKGLGFAESIRRNRAIFINHDSIYACDPDLREQKFNYLVNQQLARFRARQIYEVVMVSCAVLLALSIWRYVSDSIEGMDTASRFFAAGFAVFLLLARFLGLEKSIADRVSRRGARAIDPSLWSSFASRAAKPVSIRSMKKRIEKMKGSIAPKLDARPGSASPFRVEILKKPGNAGKMADESNVFVIDGALIDKYASANPAETGNPISQKWMAFGKDNSDKVFYYLVNRAMYITAWKDHRARAYRKALNYLAPLTVLSTAAFVFLLATGVTDAALAFFALPWSSIPLCWVYTLFSQRCDQAVAPPRGSAVFLCTDGISEKLAAYITSRRVVPARGLKNPSRQMASSLRSSAKNEPAKKKAAGSLLFAAFTRAGGADRCM